MALPLLGLRGVDMGDDVSLETIQNNAIEAEAMRIAVMEVS